MLLLDNYCFEVRNEIMDLGCECKYMIKLLNEKLMGFYNGEKRLIKIRL